jgi:hypothetical protein
MMTTAETMTEHEVRRPTDIVRRPVAAARRFDGYTEAGDDDEDEADGWNDTGDDEDGRETTRTAEKRRLSQKLRRRSHTGRFRV